MGFLEAGDPLKWEDSKEHLAYVREHGVLQFIALYNQVKDVANDDLFWGDEVEYSVLQTSSDRTVKIAVGAGVAHMQALTQREGKQHNPSLNGCAWHQEYGSWMIEGTPTLPLSGFARDLVEVETNMRSRRARLLKSLLPGQIAPTTTNFPLLGVKGFTEPPTLQSGGPYSASSLVPDDCINPHPRFGTLTHNIRARRGSKVDIRMPLFKDVHTPEFAFPTVAAVAAAAATAPPPSPPPQADASASGGCAAAAAAAMAAAAEAKAAAWEAGQTTGAAAAAELTAGGVGEGVCRGPGEEPLPFHLSHVPSGWPLVRGDCMAFGMGCCCLQVTFQSRDVDESRFMYDQLAGMAPLMLALTAATPFFKGRLVDSDVRWTAISQSTDDRTPVERGASLASSSDHGQKPDPTMAGEGMRRLSKSRYDSVSVFLCKGTPECYNDVACEVDEPTRAALLEAGLDPPLARHVGHLFARDPLVMFQGRITELPDDGTRTDHWESLQSTNWQTMRWKPPPPRDPAQPQKPHIGWRTEFRAMEVQLTDFENAACTVFIVLLTRAVLVFDLDLLMPLSKIDENMARAHCRQPVKTQSWWFRRDITPGALAGRRPSDAGAQQCPTCPKAAAAAAAANEAASSSQQPSETLPGQHCDPSDLEEMTMIQVLQGKGDYFPGLIPLCYAYLEHIGCDSETFARVDAYLAFLTARARGDVGTCADWMRNFVVNHPDYRGDSVVGDTVAHDLMVACDQVGRGVLKPPELFGNFAASIKEVSASQAYGSPLVSEKVSRDSRRDLVRAITAARLEGKGRRTTGEAAAAEAATNAAQAQTQADELEHLARRMAAAEAGLGHGDF